MQDKKTQSHSKKEYVGIKNLFELASPKMTEDLVRARKRYSSIRTRKIGYADFTKVVTLYFYYLFIEVIKEGTIFKMYQRFGNLLAVKTKCTRYTPKTVYFKRNKKGEIKVESRYLDLNKTNGYVPFVFWDSPAKWRHYRFKPVIKFRRMIYNSFINGTDYLDYTMTSNRKLLTYERA